MRRIDEKWSLLQDCRGYIEAHLPEKLDLEALAARYGYAYSSFRRFFRISTGYTIHNYIRLRRLQKAARVLRESGSVPEAMEAAGFETLSGFSKAFQEEFGVSFSAYAATRGRILMREPTILEVTDFFVVGYAFEAETTLSERQEDSAAYWLGQSFPRVSRENYHRIGGGAETVGLWVGPPGRGFYLIGSQVDRLGFVPQEMDSTPVPGGLFARFPVPPAEKNQTLCEAVRAVWFYALRQWLPASPYEEDPGRPGYEYYLSGDNAVFVPVIPREKEE